MDEFKRANMALWDEWTDIHARPGVYGIDEFRAGGNRLKALELAELGDVAGKSLLHLQCHFGLDTLSWARLGAQVTGVDFSSRAVALARTLSEECQVPGRFICCDIYDLPEHLDGTFDIVFTSYGVLNWLSDITRWARLVARYLRPGGTFYMAEFHPFIWIFDEEKPDIPLRYNYFPDGTNQAFQVQGSYADPTAEVKQTISYEWPHPLSEVVTSLIDAGLTIEYLHEFPYVCFQSMPVLVQGADGLWRMPEGKPQLPLQYSIKARK